MSRKLVSCFVRGATQSRFYFADVLKSLIIKYLNRHVVRLIEDDCHSVLVSDSNRSLGAVVRELEGDNSNSNPVHVWLRFSVLKHIYPIDTTNNDERLKVTFKDVCRDEGCFVDHWVEVPFDLYGITMHALDTLGAREIFIERWSQWCPPNALDEVDAVGEKVEMDLYSLSVGDIIDAQDNKGKWYEAVVRFACESFGCLHFVGWSAKWDERATESDRVAERGTHTKGPHLPRRSRSKEGEVDFLQCCYPNLSNVLFSVFKPNGDSDSDDEEEATMTL